MVLDLGSTGIGVSPLPEKLIWHNKHLLILRMENNDIQTIPPHFFKFSQNLESVLLDDNNINALHHDIFKPLKSLTDIHLQHNHQFEMYCDYHFTNKSVFPHLQRLLSSDNIYFLFATKSA